MYKVCVTYVANCWVASLDSNQYNIGEPQTVHRFFKTAQSYTVYAKIFKGKTFMVRMKMKIHRKTFTVAATFNSKLFDVKHTQLSKKSRKPQKQEYIL